MSAGEQLVTICTARQIEAQIIKGRLESEGIPALLSYESASLVYGITTNGLGKVRIMVPEHLAKEAKEILADRADIDTRLPGRAYDNPTWFAPFCLMLLVVGVLVGAI